MHFTHQFSDYLTMKSTRDQQRASLALMVTLWLKASPVGEWRRVTHTVFEPDLCIVYMSVQSH